MKLSGNTNIIILMLMVSQVFCISCTKNHYRDSSFQKTGRKGINKLNISNDIAPLPKSNTLEMNVQNSKLKKFLASGTEKHLNTRNVTPDEIIEAAEKYLGVPHCMGGTSMKCLDCSGLLVAAFSKHGIYLPHNSEEQARYGKIISGMAHLKRGDLVFFVRSYKTSSYITHSGIYLGRDEFIHTSSKEGVTITRLSDPYWKEKFIFGTRLLE